MCLSRTGFKFWILLVIHAVAGVAFARAEPPPGAITTVQTSVKALISHADCRWLVEHSADADVAYQPGVDVHGRRVAPADLPGGVRVVLPDEYVIDLEVDLQTLLGIAPPPGIDPDLQLGKIQLRGNKVYLNDHPLFDEEQEKLVARCRDALDSK